MLCTYSCVLKRTRGKGQKWKQLTAPHSCIIRINKLRGSRLYAKRLPTTGGSWIHGIGFVVSFVCVCVATVFSLSSSPRKELQVQFFPSNYTLINLVKSGFAMLHWSHVNSKARHPPQYLPPRSQLLR